MEEKALNEKESLELISQMIRNTQQKLERKNGIPFLIWGYVTVIVSLTVWYMLKITMDAHWNYLWFLIPVLGYTAMLIFSQKEEKGMKTYIDKVIGYVWICMGSAALIVSISAMFVWMPVYFIILLLIGIGTTITALVIKFKLLIYLGFICIMSSEICLIIRDMNAILVFAFMFLIMMVIPGHVLYAKKGIQHV